MVDPLTIRPGWMTDLERFLIPNHTGPELGQVPVAAHPEPVVAEIRLSNSSQVRTPKR